MKVLKEEVIFESFSLTWISVEFLLSLGGEQQAKWVCQWLSSKWSAKKYEEGRRRILLQQTAVYHSTLLHSRSAHTQPTSISSCPHISLVSVFSFKDIGCTHHNLTYVALSLCRLLRQKHLPLNWTEAQYIQYGDVFHIKCIHIFDIKCIHHTRIHRIHMYTHVYTLRGISLI